MRTIFVRHGNTFNKGDEVVWVGARTDLPLTEKGEEQAIALGERLKELSCPINRIIAGPLKRTHRHAEIIAEIISFNGQIEIDERLREIDYGLWEGKTSAYIEEHFGKDVIDKWGIESIQPSNCNWSPTADEITSAVTSLANTLASSKDEENVLVVTSNGIMRYFLNLIPGEFDAQVANNNHKVKTGNVCSMLNKNGDWKLENWNLNPNELAIS